MIFMIIVISSMIIIITMIIIIRRGGRVQHGDGLGQAVRGRPKNNKAHKHKNMNNT